MKEKTKLTAEGKKKLEEELDLLIHKTRDEVSKQVGEARAQGDLSENADYDAARDRQAKVEARIRELKNILDNCEIIDAKASPKGTTKVGLGHTVKITFLPENKEDEFTLVGTVEANPFNKLISTDSPLGAAILGKSIGDTVAFTGGKNTAHTVRIEEIYIK